MELRNEPHVHQYMQDAPPSIVTEAIVTEAASDVVAGLIAEGLQGVELTISPAIRWENAAGRLGEPGEFIVAGAPRDLVEWAFHDLMLAVAQSVPMATCEECARMFVLNHANRRFCSSQCNNRARQRRHAEKQRHE